MMSPRDSGLVRSWPWCQIVAIRDPTARSRQCTPLELLFDLCFVVSVAALVVELHHHLVDGHPEQGVLTYVLLFLPICWAWMLFSWFAAAYDNDDVIYRVLTMGQMAGVLGLTITIPAAFEGDFVPFAVGYVVMRVPLVLKWIRTARSRTDEHRYAVRYSVGLVVCQVLWLGVLLVAHDAQPLFLLAVMAVELLVPPWAIAAAGRQVFHAQHISERFGLFTMIVIGESILATTIALEAALELHRSSSMVLIGAATLLSAFCVWWLYFDVLDGRAIVLDRARALPWGHGHMLAFCSISAMGAAADVAIEVESNAMVFDVGLRLAVVAPAAVTVLALTWIHSVTAHRARFHTASRVLAAATILLAGLMAGELGPVAATVTAAGVLLILAVTETTIQGVAVRRATVRLA